MSDLEIPDDLLAAEPGSDAFAVWADELMRRGEAWGELIQLCRARVAAPAPEIDARMAELEAEHGSRWWGRVPEGIELRFRDGFIDEVLSARTFHFTTPGLDRTDPDAYRFLAAPISARIRRLHLHTVGGGAYGQGWRGDRGALVGALASRRRSFLTTLHLDDGAPFDESTGDARLTPFVRTMVNDQRTRWADWMPLFAEAPALEHLVIGDGFSSPNEPTPPGAIDAPKLRTVALGFRPVSAAMLRTFGEAALPGLEVLALRLGDQVAGRFSVEVVSKVLNNPSLGNLRSLGLIGGHDVSELLPVLVASPCFEHLTQLDLSGAHASDAAWRAFIRDSTRAPLLEKIYVTPELQSVSAEAFIMEALPVTWESQPAPLGGSGP